MFCSSPNRLLSRARMLELPRTNVSHEANPRWRLHVQAAAFLATALLAACADDTTPIPAGAGAQPKSSSASAHHRQGQGLEEEGALGRFAAANPEFGGWFYDRDGDLNVWVLDPGDRGERIRSAVEQEVAREPRDIMEPAVFKIKLRPARYGFIQLSDWRDRISTRFSTIRGMRWTDLDDVRNRVSVGVESRRTRADVRRAAAGLGIPAGALNVMVVSTTSEECTPDMLVCEGKRISLLGHCG